MHTWPTPLRTVTIGGTPLEYHDVGEGPCLVLFHGGQCSADDWAHLALDLGRDHRLIVPDGLVHPHDGWATWVLLDHLGISEAALLGHSAGGRPVRAMALARPERVWAAIDVDADVAGAQLLARKLSNDRYSAPARAMYDARRAEMQQLRPHHQGDYPSQVTIDCRLRGYARSAMTPEQKQASRGLAALPSAADLPRLEPPAYDPDGAMGPPVLKIITGRGKIDQADVEGLPVPANRRAADLTVVVMKEFGHWPWLEDEPAFLDVIRPFLRRCRGM